MKKEILTKDLIKTEIKKQLFRSIIYIIPYNIFLTLISSILISNTLKNNKFDLLFFIITLPLFIITIICWYYLTISILNISKIKNDKYKIVSDKLLQIKKRIGTDDIYTSPFCRPNSLFFQSHGRYILPYGKNHKLSEEIYIDEDQIVNFATEGDIFYLVLLNNKILTAYNSKLFELQL